MRIPAGSLRPKGDFSEQERAGPGTRPLQAQSVGNSGFDNLAPVLSPFLHRLISLLSHLIFSAVPWGLGQVPPFLF